MTDHLDAVSLARYLAGSETPDERARWEIHLGECAECLEEMIEVRRILARSPRRRWVALMPLAAAAAVLVLVWTGTANRSQPGPTTRDPTLTTTIAPRPIAPLGAVSTVEMLRWNAVPGVLHYRVTLFTDDGQAAWQATTTDTFVATPDTLRLVAGSPYYWQVKAQTSFGRWVESELVLFTVVPPIEQR